MRVFVTGATGFVGSAVVAELLSAGHQVLGLARSDANAEALARAGAESHRGDLLDPDGLAAAARACDGVIHTAFIHDFSRFKEVCETDRLAITALGAALEGSDRPLIVTSGTGLVAPGRLATEEDTPDPAAHASPRIASEQAAMALAERGVRAMIVRLSPSVHGDGDHGFVPMLIKLARDKGVSAYIDAGLNRWTGVHRLDAARLYRLALERGAAGSRFHGVDEEGVPFRGIAEVIGRRLGIPVEAKSGEAAADHFGWFGFFAGLDCPASSARTRATLGWEPTHPGLLADIDRPGYFQT